MKVYYKKRLTDALSDAIENAASLERDISRVVLSRDEFKTIKKENPGFQFHNIPAHLEQNRFEFMGLIIEVKT